MIQFSKFLVFAFFVLNSCNKKKELDQLSKKPNILFIFTDDQTYNSINALGNKEIITPNLDTLVANGTTFTHAYNMGSWSGAVCAASRAMMISGRSVWHANQFRQHWKQGDSLSKTWGKLMQSAGYNTYMTGKWHVDAPAKKVFQKVTHERPGMPNDAWNHSQMVAKFDSISKIPNAKSDAIMPLGYNRPQHKNDTTWTPTNTKFGGFWQGGTHWSEVLADDAITFMDTASTMNNPFFMYLAFNAPHDPRQAPQKYQDMYKLSDISLPKSWLPEYPDRHQIANGNNLRDEALAPFPRTEYATKVNIKEYYASITHLDAQIGKILKALKTSGKDKNTYIIFTADHGLAMGKHGLLGKQNLYDHSIRPPLVITGPDIPKNKKITTDVYLQDVMATSLELAGAKKPNYVFFNSFKNLATGSQQRSNYSSIYGAYLTVQRMIRKNDFKLLVYPKAKKLKLFDLKNDPEEMNNLAQDAAYSSKVSSLFEDLKKLQLQMQDTLNLKQLNYYQLKSSK
ncbi:sulfatase-like hydrolase/transferase [Aquimarina agarivorans]|uniref:sulfatase-like hydrolase/transferase n=1 Tax=Aquimarina agarivorans TaxID=980584 RepID=UPI000248F8A9|nr:sulfatase-like hydrolase/transferase [Aquimarina agarivorans]